MACTSKARSAYWSKAVTNTMAGARSTPTSRSTSNPSSSGICTSRNTRSGATSRIAAAASRPFAHSPATTTSGSAASRCRIPSRPASSSSTINVRIARISSTLMSPLPIGSRQPERHDDVRNRSAISRVHHFERRLIAVQLLQTRAGVGESHAAVFRALEDGNEPRAIVPDREVQAAVDTSGADQEPTNGAARRDPVANRVFDERLEDQIGYLGVERFGLGVHHRCEALPEPNLLDVEVVSQELQLLLQRDLLRTRAIEHPPQQIAQPGQHADGEGILTGANELADGVQRIEQEVRLELHLERFQARRGELGFELRGAQLPFPQPPVMRDAVVACDDRPVEPAVQRKPPHEVAQLGHEQWIVARHRAPEPPLVHDHQQYFQEHRGGAGQEVHSDAARPKGALERRIAPAEPDGRRSENGPHERARHVEAQRRQERHGLAAQAHVHRDLRRQQQAPGGPDRQDHPPARIRRASPTARRRKTRGVHEATTLALSRNPKHTRSDGLNWNDAATNRRRRAVNGVGRATNGTGRWAIMPIICDPGRQETPARLSHRSRERTQLNENPASSQRRVWRLPISHYR